MPHDEGDEDFASRKNHVSLSDFFKSRVNAGRLTGGFHPPHNQSRQDANSASGGLSTPPSPSTRSLGLSSDGTKPPPLSRFNSGRRRHFLDSTNDFRSMHTDQYKPTINAFISNKARRDNSDDISNGKLLFEVQGDHTFILRPDRPFRHHWDMFVLLLLIYAGTVSVFVYSFLDVFGPRSAWFWIERFIDLLFVVDIVLNFFTAYEKNGVMVTDRKAIRREYATTWLIPDVLATFPWDAIALSIKTRQSDPQLWHLPRFIRLVRLFKLLRLVRILRLKDSFTRLEVKLRIKYGYIRLAGLFISVMFVAHWVACLFYYFGAISGANNWIAALDVDVQKDLYGKYIAALYFSVYTITTIGYGDVTPENTLERSYTTVIMFLGAALFAYVISQVSNISGELNATSIHHRVMMDSLTDLAKCRQLPDKLVSDIRHYFQRDHLRQRVADEKQLLEGINRDLRIKVLKHMYGTHLENARLFRDIPKEQLDDVYDSVSERLARKDEKLFSEGDCPVCFYIILSGTVELREPGMPPVQLTTGEIVGENDILFNRLRRSSAVCNGYTDLIVVPRMSVMNVLKRHPSALKKLRDDEALWLWNDAISLVEQQIRFANMANSLRRSAEAHALKKGLETGQRVNTARPAPSGMRGSISHLALSVVPSPELERRARSVSSTDMRDGGFSDVASDVGPGGDVGDRRISTVEVMQRELESKSREVERLESKLKAVQDQLHSLLGGLQRVD